MAVPVDPGIPLTLTRQWQLPLKRSSLISIKAWSALTRSGRIIPCLAESWEISEDGTTYTFRIREGVLFHNGRRLTAADVVYSLERIKDDATGFPKLA